MNRIILFALALSLAALPLHSAAPFSRSAAGFVKDITLGINIGNTLDCPSGNETEWGNRPVTRSLLRLYKAKGINAVRLPVTWRRQFDRDDPKHAIRPAFLDRVQEVIDMCMAEGFVTILDIHHDGGSEGWPEEWLTIDGVNEDRANQVLADLWRQIATRFRNYGEKLLFQGFNEIRKAKSHPGPGGGEEGKDDWGGPGEVGEALRVRRTTLWVSVLHLGAGRLRVDGADRPRKGRVVPSRDSRRLQRRPQGRRQKAVDSLDATEACFAIDSFRTIMVKSKH